MESQVGGEGDLTHADTGRTEKIGNVVLDYSHYPEQDFFTATGVGGHAFLELVKTIPPEDIPRKSIKRQAGRVLYHLSDLRGKISSDGCLLAKA